MREPELRHLRYFVAVAEELHFGRAAARLNMAQPPLSQQIRQLEEIVGHRLLERRPAVALTPAGIAFLDLARATLRQVRQGLEAVRRSQDGAFGVLNVGLASSTAVGPAPEVIRTFGTRRPNVLLQIHEMSTAEQAEALRSGRIDVGFMREPEPDAAMVVEARFEEPFVCALPPGHPLAGRASLSARLLADEPFVLFPRMVAPRLHDQVRSICAAAGYQPDVVQEAGEWLTILGLVEAGTGVSFAPASFRRVQWGGVAYVAISDPVVNTTVALCRRDGDPAALAADFAEVAREVFLAHTP